MSKYISPARAIGMLERAVATAGSQKAYCDRTGADEADVSRALSAKRNLTTSILRDLGLVKTTAYLRKNP